MRIVFASIIVIFVALGAVLWWMRAQFLDSLQQRIEAVEASEPATVESLDRLPPLVRQYLEQNGVEPGSRHTFCHFTQTGEMKLAADGEWQEFSAEQWMSATRSSFVWKPRMSMPVGSVIGSDWLDGDAGGLQMRLFGAIPVATAEGPSVAEGELARYLSELPWNPAAMALNPAIRWTQDDERHATATLAVGELSSTVTFEFDERGDITSVLSPGRPRGSGEATERLPWGGEFWEYDTFDGIRVPTRARVFWEEPDGRYVYWRGQVTAFDCQ